MKENKSNKFNLVERRDVLRMLGACSFLTLPNWVLGKNRIWAPKDLPLTPSQTQGPFYPNPTIEQQLFNDTDLIQKLGDHEFAIGKRVIVEGVITDCAGMPLPNSIVEIWQACASGRYNHQFDDENPGLLDNNFQFWGRAITAKDGKYSFKTVIPGKYPGRTARHIHYRVDSPGFRRLTTQCYFSDYGEDNKQDFLYQDLSSAERDLVTVELDKPTFGLHTGPGTRSRKGNPFFVGQFNMVLERI